MTTKGIEYLRQFASPLSFTVDGQGISDALDEFDKKCRELAVLSVEMDRMAKRVAVLRTAVDHCLLGCVHSDVKYIGQAARAAIAFDDKELEALMLRAKKFVKPEVEKKKSVIQIVKG